MHLDDLKELHYISHMSNVSSILVHGLLSYQAAAKLPHESVAAEEIQARRRRVRVPIPGGSRPLHAYVNLYISARNSMLRRVRNRHNDLCVLRVNKAVLAAPGVVVASCNASSDYVRWGAGEDGLAVVDKELVFAEFWTHADPIEYYRRKSAKSAEVLVPDRVPPDLIFGAYLSTPENLNRLGQTCQPPAEFQVQVDQHLFFL